MNSYKHTLRGILVILVALLTFTSCEEDDYEWRDGKMDYYATINTPSNGIMRADLTIDYNWVTVDYGRFHDVEDIRFYDGYIYIKPGTYIDYFTLSLSNSNVELPVNVRNSRGGSLEGRQVENFLNAVVEVVRRYGYATIYVDGRADGLSRVDLDFYIDIDAYVRY